jgi:hypothetical protein
MVKIGVYKLFELEKKCGDIATNIAYKKSKFPTFSARKLPKIGIRPDFNQMMVTFYQV